MKKKEFLTETKRKVMLSEKEKLIVETFAKNFNKIKRIDEAYGMSFEEAKAEAKRISDEEGGVAQHVNKVGGDMFVVSDFFDADTTVASFGMGIDETSMMKMDEGTSTGVSDMLVTLDYDNDMTKIEDKHYHNGPDGSIDYEIDTIESNFDFDDTMSIVENLISKHKWNKIYITVVVDGEEHKDSFDAIYWKGLNYWIKNQINEYDGEDYEKASREVQYGINPYEEEQSLFDNVDRISVARPEYNGAVMNSIYGIYIIYKDGKQEKLNSVEEFNEKIGTDMPLTKDPREVVSYIETNYPEVTVYLDEFDVS
jgi:hypothetical protein